MGAKREYTAIFRIGAQLLGSFRGAIAQAQARLRGLATAARRVGGFLKSIFSSIGAGLISGFAAFFAADIFSKIFRGAQDEAVQAEQRTRSLMGALMLNQKIAKGGTAVAKEQLDLIYKHNEGIQKQGVLHKDVLDNMAVQLALKGGIPPAAIQDSIDVMQNLLVATRGVTATEEDGTNMAKAWANAISRGRLMGLANQGVQITKEQTKEFGKLKTVQQRQLWLMKNIGKSYQMVNAEARKTDIGRIQLFSNTMKDLSQEIGNVLLPAQADMAEAWRTFLEDPEIRAMLIGSVRRLGQGISALADIVKTDLIPVLKTVGESEAFKKLAGYAKSAFTYTKRLFDLMGLVAKAGAPYDETIAQRRKAFPTLKGPFMPDVSEAEKTLAPMQKLTNLELFKVGAPLVKEFNATANDLPSSLIPSTAAMNDFKAAGQQVGIMALVASPELINMAEGATRVGDSLANVDDWFSRLNRTLAEFAGSIPLIGARIQGAVPNTKPMQQNAPGFVPTFQHGGVVDRPTLAMIGERGPEAVVPLGKGISGETTVHFAPNITINGGASAGELSMLDSKLRDLARDFVAQFKRAQGHERRLSYEGGYS